MTQPYRILVTGSRNWTDRATICSALTLYASADELRQPLTIVHGNCPTGADAIANTWCLTRRVTVEPHPAKGHPTQDFGPWPGAGPRRNAFMVSLGADLCLAFIGPCTSLRCRKSGRHPSHGATGCADLAEHAGIPTQRRYL